MDKIEMPEEFVKYDEVKYGRLIVALWRCADHPGGLDWVKKAGELLAERDKTRDVLLRADERQKCAEKACACVYSEEFAELGYSEAVRGSAMLRTAIMAEPEEGTK